MESAGRLNRPRRAASTLALSFLAVVAAAGCTRGDAAPQGAVVKVHLQDFKLTTTKVLVPAGLVTFRVSNAGPSTHDFNVDRTDIAADALPKQASGLSVDEDSKRLHRVGDVDNIRMGAKRDLTLRLSPGHYVLYCNLEGHYLGGMYAMVQVRG